MKRLRKPLDKWSWKIYKIAMIRRLFFLMVAFALFTAGIVSAADARVGEQVSAQQVELGADQGTADDGGAVDAMYDMYCGHHHHVAVTNFFQDKFCGVDGEISLTLSDAPVSFFVYELKRPPRA